MGIEKFLTGLTGYQIFIKTFSKLEDMAKIDRDRQVGR